MSSAQVAAGSRCLTPMLLVSVCRCCSAMGRAGRAGVSASYGLSQCLISATFLFFPGSFQCRTPSLAGQDAWAEAAISHPRFHAAAGDCCHPAEQGWGPPAGGQGLGRGGWEPRGLLGLWTVGARVPA